MAEKGWLGITKGPKDLKTPICYSEGQVPPFAPSHVDAYGFNFTLRLRSGLSRVKKKISFFWG